VKAENEKKKKKKKKGPQDGHKIEHQKTETNVSKRAMTTITAANHSSASAHKPARIHTHIHTSTPTHLERGSVEQRLVPTVELSEGRVELSRWVVAGGPHAVPKPRQALLPPRSVGLYLS